MNESVHVAKTHIEASITYLNGLLDGPALDALFAWKEAVATNWLSVSKYIALWTFLLFAAYPAALLKSIAPRRGVIGIGDGRSQTAKWFVDGRLHIHFNVWVGLLSISVIATLIYLRFLIWHDQIVMDYVLVEIRRALFGS